MKIKFSGRATVPPRFLQLLGNPCPTPRWLLRPTVVQCQDTRCSGLRRQGFVARMAAWGAWDVRVVNQHLPKEGCLCYPLITYCVQEPFWHWLWFYILHRHLTACADTSSDICGMCIVCFGHMSTSIVNKYCFVFVWWPQPHLCAVADLLYITWYINGSRCV